MMRQVHLIMLSLVVAAAACSAPRPTPRPVNPPSTPQAPSAFEGRAVSASAEIVPAQKAQLSFTIAGRMQKVAVAIGDSVKAGQVLAELEASDWDAAVKQAEGAMERAQAQLNQVRAGPREQEIAVAEAGLAAAKANLKRLWTGPDEKLLIAARAEAANAEAAVKQAQAAYDRAGGASNPYASMLPTSLQLEQATNNSIAAKARLEALQKGATAADIEAAQAEIRRAQAQLDLVKAGPRIELIAVAEADVTNARFALDTAKVQSSHTQMRAPFDGKIAEIQVTAGEAVTPGQVVLLLADLDHLQVETTDLSERGVSQVAAGQPANIFVEALNQELEGHVVRIAPRSNKVGGDVVYAVTIDLDGQPAGLRWGMSAKVDIAAK